MQFASSNSDRCGGKLRLAFDLNELGIDCYNHYINREIWDS
jgi:hypothetical protein